MFCNNCGTQVNDGQTFCPNCGAAQTPQANNSNTYSAAAPSTEGVALKSSSLRFGLYDVVTIALCFFMLIIPLLPFLSLSAMSFGMGISMNFSYFDLSDVADMLKMSGMDADLNNLGAYFMIICAIAIFVLYMMRKENLSILPVAVTLIFVLISSLNVGDLSNIPDTPSGMIKLGLGGWLCWIVPIAAALLPFTPLKSERKFK